MLDNGLRLIVWPDRAIPNVALNNWIRVGSRNERAGITGLAHFCEHMMFNGTAKFASGEFDRLLEAHGGSNNAYTSDDVTVYQEWFPASALELVFELEADRLANLKFTPAMLETERRVVQSERRLHVDDSNAGTLSERVQAAAFRVHPYRFPTIGWSRDIRAWRRPHLERFFHTYYAPNNQTLVIVGDVSVRQAARLARQWLGRIPRRRAPPPVRRREPEQLAERRVSLRRAGQTPLLQYAYKAPAVRSARANALRLLIAALVEGNGSRLHRVLVDERKLAVEVGGGWHEGFDPSLLWFHLVLPEGGDPRAAAAVLDGELEYVAAHGVSEQELARAKNLAAAQYWRQLSTIDGKAQLLGEYAVLRGDWRLLFAAPAHTAAVTRAQVTAVARTVLDRRRRTVGSLEPRARRRRR